MRTFGKNARNNIIVMQFAMSLLLIRVDDIVDDNVVVINLSDPKGLEQTIKNKISSLAKRLKETNEIIIQAGGIKLANSIRKEMELKTYKAIQYIQKKKFNAEFLAIYILLVNFAEIEQKVLPEQRWLQDSNIYFEILDLLSKSSVNIVEEDMFLASYDIINILKG